MKIIFFIFLLMIFNTFAFGFPSPDAFSKAELQVLASHEPRGRDVIFWGQLESVTRTGEDADGNSLYVVKSMVPGQRQYLCVDVKIKSEVAPAPLGQRSSEEVVAKIKTVSTPWRCQ